MDAQSLPRGETEAPIARGLTPPRSYALLVAWLERPRSIGKVALLAAPIERIVRNPARTPFRPRDEVALSRMRVTVVDVNANAAPTRVRFEFPSTLEQLAVDWWIWEGKRAARWKPPPPGGETRLRPAFAFP